MRGTRAARAAPPVTGPVRAVHTTVVAVIAVVAVLAASGCGSVERAPLRSSVVLAELPPLGRVHAEEPPRVLIFGDSIAAQHGNPAAFALRDAGVDAEVFALWGHGLFTREQYDIGAPRPDPPALSLMAAASAEVADFDPDVVAVYINHNYWPPYPRDAAGAVIARGSPAFAAMAGTQITELVHRLSAGGATIYLIEPAPEGPGATAADNPVWAGYLAARDDLGFQVIDSGDAVADAEGAWVADLPDCTGSPVRVRPPGDLHLTYFGAGLMGTRTANALAEAVDWPISDLRAPSQAPAAMLPMGTGYRLVTCDGGTFHFGVGGSALGALPPEDSLGVGESVVGAATALDGDGAWLLTSAGRVRGLAGAPHLGDAELARGDRAVAITPTPTGAGYWVATASGAVQAFGDAEKLGDLAGSADPVVAITATADGDGYWLATAGGRVAAFGAAPERRDLAGAPPAAGVVAMAAHPDGGGYWLLDGAGGVHPFGTAADLGSAANQDMAVLSEFRSVSDFDVRRVPASQAPTRAVAMLPTPSGRGYRVWLANGAVCSFGDAHPFGGLHRAEVDEIMIYKDQPYYAEGPCAQDVGFGPPTDGT